MIDVTEENRKIHCRKKYLNIRWRMRKE